MSIKLNKQQSKPQKKSYSSPQLTRFGTISELTSGGSANMDEFGPMALMMLMRMI